MLACGQKERGWLPRTAHERSWRSDHGDTHGVTTAPAASTA